MRKEFKGREKEHRISEIYKTETDGRKIQISN